MHRYNKKRTDKVARYVYSVQPLGGMNQKQNVPKYGTFTVKRITPLKMEPQKWHKISALDWIGLNRLTCDLE